MLTYLFSGRMSEAVITPRRIARNASPAKPLFSYGTAHLAFDAIDHHILLDLNISLAS